jgi:hypothetical protein
MEDRAGVLREYERWRGSHPWPDLHDPELVQRWYVTLECGCDTEALTLGDDHPPTEGLSRGLRREEPCASRQVFVVDWHSHTIPKGDMPLWAGHFWCGGHDTACPWREVTEWTECTEERHTWTSSVAGKLEHHGPRDMWAVRLSCGHRTKESVPVGWLPEHGHRQDPGKARKLREHWAKVDNEDALGHYRDFLLPWVEDGCPEPQTGTDCNICANLRRVVSYEPIGLLTWPGDSARPSPEALARQLRSADARVDELTQQLADARVNAAKLRNEAKGMRDL